MSRKIESQVVALSAALLLFACGGAPKEEAAPAAHTELAAASPAAADVAVAPATGDAAAPATEGGEYTVAAVTGGGTVTGTAKIGGTVPAAEKIEVTKDNATCGAEKEVMTVHANAAGALGNVVVWLDGIKSGKPWPGGEGSIDQKSCEYQPHMQGVALNSKLVIKNSDPVLHNIHAYTGEDTLFNIAQPTEGQTNDKKMSKAGPVQFKCDVHSWMNAWVFVSPHPYYAITGDDGSFSIGDVPPGTYKVKSWQEKLGEQEMEVKVEAGGKAEANFTFTPK